MTDDVFTKSDIAKSTKQPQGSSFPSAFKTGYENDMIKEYNTGDPMM